MARLSRSVALFGISAALVGVPASASGPGIALTSTVLVSASTTGGVGNGNSNAGTISANGQFVVFESAADNLVSGDTNGARDDFVRDTQTGATIRVSVASDGTQGDGDSVRAVMSADGGSVAFESRATNLVSGDTNGVQDIFVHDMHTGTTTRVSVASDGTQGNALSFLPTISADGQFVAFESGADNLVSGDTNGTDDVFVHDMQTGATTRVSVASDGTQGNNESYEPTISADGRYVTFGSSASNLVAGDTNGTDDVFVHDMQTGATTRVSVASDGTEENGNSYQPTISADDRYVAFESDSSNLVLGDTNGADDVFVHDMQTGATTRVSVDSGGTQGNDDSGAPAISGDGRYVAFDSAASNLVDGDTNGVNDAFVHDTVTGQTLRISTTPDGTQGDGPSYLATVQQPEMTSDGASVVFESLADNLVAGDTNGNYDAFVARLSLPSTLSTLTVSKSGSGSGSVTSSPAGVDCGATCSHGYDHGAMVTLTASPAAGSSFTGWSGGGCSGVGTCAVTMDADTAVIATFDLVPVPVPAAPPASRTLAIGMGGAGAGTVTSPSPTAISCATPCSPTLEQGTSLTLTATAQPGSAFTGWSGDCSGTGTCTLTMDADHAVTATFGRLPTTLTVVTSPSGGGTVTSTPAGIDCGSSCSHQFAYGSTVTLTASAHAGSSFAGWSGACSGKGACTTTMNADSTVIAHFQALVRCVVPNVVGEPLGQARRTIVHAYCAAGRIRHAHSRTVAKGHVISQQPAPGTNLAKGGKVGLVVSEGK